MKRYKTIRELHRRNLQRRIRYIITVYEYTRSRRWRENDFFFFQNLFYILTVHGGRRARIVSGLSSNICVCDQIEPSLKIPSKNVMQLNLKN